MTELADVCHVQHFPQADNLRVTLWRQLPIMANSLGKKRFKRSYLELFLDLLFHNLELRQTRENSPLSVNAAEQCMEQLAILIGTKILHGRLEENWQQKILVAIMDEAKNEKTKKENDKTNSPLFSRRYQAVESLLYPG